MIARALVAGMLAAGIASAAPPEVPLVLVDAPPTFDAARLATSLETYVTNATVVTSAHGAGPDAALCADALAAARAGGVPVALWARWQGGTMIVALVRVEQGCAAAESSTVDVPPDQPEFVYRVAALKIASLLRVLPEPAPDPVPVDPVVAPPPPTVVARPHVPAASARTVELGATGVASTEVAARTYAAVVSAWLGSRPAVGIAVLASAAHEATAAGGSGSARVAGALVGVRAPVWSRGRFVLVAELDAGVLAVWSSAARITGADAMSESALTPFVAVAPHVRVRLTDALHLTLGPTLDLSPRTVDLAVGEVPLYHAGVVRFRWDARAQIWF